MSTKASDWYLYADTDLHDPENAVQFFKYWQAIRAEQIEHYINHKEFIPQFVLVERLVELNVDWLVGWLVGPQRA